MARLRTSRQLASARPRKESSYLIKGKANALCILDEPQAAHRPYIVATRAAVCWFPGMGDQSTTFVITDRFDVNPCGLRNLSDSQIHK